MLHQQVNFITACFPHFYSLWPCNFVNSDNSRHPSEVLKAEYSTHNKKYSHFSLSLLEKAKKEKVHITFMNSTDGAGLLHK